MLMHTVYQDRSNKVAARGAWGNEARRPAQAVNRLHRQAGCARSLPKAVNDKSRCPGRQGAQPSPTGRRAGG